ncbi:YqaJ viral recombinase [uncultured virus]|nr:YqaJ viral recombinase [uncultured virus]
MVISKINEKNIRTLIKQNFLGQQFTENDLPNLFTNLHTEFKNTFKNNDVQEESLRCFVLQYLHLSLKENKYFINLKKKQKSKNENNEIQNTENISNNIPENNQITIKPNDFIQKDTTIIDQCKQFCNEPIDDKIINNILCDEKQSDNAVPINILDSNVEQNLLKDDIKTNDINLQDKNNLSTEQNIINNESKNINNKSNSDSEIDSEDLNKLEEEFFGKYDINDQINKKMVLKKRTGPAFEPFGTQWVHDKQTNDVINDYCKSKTVQFNYLSSLKFAKQKSEEWLEIRNNKITASDGGTVLGLNKYEPMYSFILKKTVGSPFRSNEYCYHGKKFEDVATMIYEYRKNVRITGFGLLAHPKYSFLGASPDGICNRYKYDNIHLSKYVGTMLEIKCPLVRKLKKTGEIIDNICPIYYWIQVQLQLECCDLDDCDFWQCIVSEYNSREEFIQDTNPNEPFRSKKTDFEKGCLIQLIPKKRFHEVLEGKYDEIVYEDAIFINPPKIEMSPLDIDVWISKTLSYFNQNLEYKDFIFDRIVYWKLDDSFNITIKRDKNWFKNHLPKMTQMWDYVCFFRKNPDKLDLLVKYIDNMDRKIEKEIMSLIDKLYKINDLNYEKFICKLTEDLKDYKKVLQPIKNKSFTFKKNYNKNNYNNYYNNQNKFNKKEQETKSEYLFVNDKN